MSKFLGRRYGAGGGADGYSDHGLLTGLGDDDHLHYLITSAVRTTGSPTSGLVKTDSGAGDVFSLINAGSGAALYIRQTGTTTDADAAVDIDNTGNIRRGLSVLTSTVDPIQPLVQFSALDYHFDEPVLSVTHAAQDGLALYVDGDAYMSNHVRVGEGITISSLGYNPIDLGDTGIYIEGDPGTFYFVDADGYKFTFGDDNIHIETALQEVLYALDGYHPDQTGTEHYHQHSQAIQTILGELDGYAVDQTVIEHYVQHSDAFQTIIKELDGYINEDVLVKVTAEDGYSGYLSEKIIPGPGISFTIINTDGYGEQIRVDNALDQTIQEHYHQHSEVFNLVRKELDGYDTRIIINASDIAFNSQRITNLDFTVTEHYNQHGDIFQDILKALDGYQSEDLDVQVKVSAEDGYTGYLQDKLVPGIGIDFRVIDTDAYGEQIVIDNALDQTVHEHYHQHSEVFQTIIKALDGYQAEDLDVQVKVTENDGYTGYLWDKIIPGPGINFVLVDEDGYGEQIRVDNALDQTIQEHYQAHSEVFNLVRKELDGYDTRIIINASDIAFNSQRITNLDFTVTEHYNQHGDIFQDILKALDGYQSEDLDVQVKVTEGDGYTGYLQDKLAAGVGIELRIIDSDAYGEQIVIDNALDQTIHEHYHQHSEVFQTILKSLDGYQTQGPDVQVKVSAEDGYTGYLWDKITPGPGIHFVLVDADGYGEQIRVENALDETIQDHYHQHSEVFSLVRKELDGYDTRIIINASDIAFNSQRITNLDFTVTEHYNQHGDIFQDILKALDGYGGQSENFDIQVKVTEDDGYTGYLWDKIIPGPGIHFVLVDTDGYGEQIRVENALDETIQDHYHQHSQVFQTVIKELDGYDTRIIINASDIATNAFDIDINTQRIFGLDFTVTEHYNQHGDIFQTIIKELDGYASAINGHDGYIAFFIGEPARAIAGDNDLFYDRVNSRLKLNAVTLSGHTPDGRTAFHINAGTGSIPVIDDATALVVSKNSLEDCYIDVIAGNQDYAGVIFGRTNERYLGGITYHTNIQNMYFHANGGVRAVMDGSGKLRLASSSPPVNYLDVPGSVAIGSYAGTSNVLGNSLAVSGSVGVGVQNPSEKLEVSDSSDPAIRITRTATSDNYLTLRHGSTTEPDITRINADEANNHADTQMRIGIDGNDTLNFLGSNVGIGTTSPNELLTLEGVMSFKELSSSPTDDAGYGKLFVKSTDGHIYLRTSGGEEFDLTKDLIGGGGGGGGDGDGYCCFIEVDKLTSGGGTPGSLANSTGSDSDGTLTRNSLNYFTVAGVTFTIYGLTLRSYVDDVIVPTMYYEIYKNDVLIKNLTAVTSVTEVLDGDRKEPYVQFTLVDVDLNSEVYLPGNSGTGLYEFVFYGDHTSDTKPLYVNNIAGGANVEHIHFTYPTCSFSGTQQTAIRATQTFDVQVITSTDGYELAESVQVNAGDAIQSNVALTETFDGSGIWNGTVTARSAQGNGYADINVTVTDQYATVSTFSTTDMGDALVLFDNDFPAIESFEEASDFSYPPNQTCLKYGEFGDAYMTVTDFTEILYSSPTGRLSFENSTTYEEVKRVTWDQGSTAIEEFSSNNIRIRARKATNCSESNRYFNIDLDDTPPVATSVRWRRDNVGSYTLISPTLGLGTHGVRIIFDDPLLYLPEIIVQDDNKGTLSAFSGTVPGNTFYATLTVTEADTNGCSELQLINGINCSHKLPLAADPINNDEEEFCVDILDPKIIRVEIDVDISDGYWNDGYGGPNALNDDEDNADNTEQACELNFSSGVQSITATDTLTRHGEGVYTSVEMNAPIESGDTCSFDASAWGASSSFSVFQAYPHVYQTAFTTSLGSTRNDDQGRAIGRSSVFHGTGGDATVTDLAANSDTATNVDELSANGIDDVAGYISFSSDGTAGGTFQVSTDSFRAFVINRKIKIVDDNTSATIRKVTSVAVDGTITCDGGSLVSYTVAQNARAVPLSVTDAEIQAWDTNNGLVAYINDGAFTHLTLVDFANPEAFSQHMTDDQLTQNNIGTADVDLFRANFWGSKISVPNTHGGTEANPTGASDSKYVWRSKRVRLTTNPTGVQGTNLRFMVFGFSADTSYRNVSISATSDWDQNANKFNLNNNDSQIEIRISVDDPFCAIPPHTNANWFLTTDFEVSAQAGFKFGKTKDINLTFSAPSTDVIDKDIYIEVTLITNSSGKAPQIDMIGLSYLT